MNSPFYCQINKETGKGISLSNTISDFKIFCETTSKLYLGNGLVHSCPNKLSKYFRMLSSERAPTARNFDAAFGDGSVKKHTTPCQYAKFESGDASLTNVDRGRQDTDVHNEVLRVIVEQNPGNIVWDYAEELSATSTNLSSYLTMIDKVKKWINGFFEILREKRMRIKKKVNV
ncbi:hypothetical protein TNCT_675801 [Trichonephila clavata]|uniref:Uncharacterized protein n=1 Tax=Trichonephila clavata TaxID=2740835 RepID=A0A8X6JB86_TRICU|nr:hypothetical protein TNCT_675801 [Trichonephila clavata]